jgi:hypothetical protein
MGNRSTKMSWQEISKRLVRALILWLLPKNTWGDKVYAFILFVRAHKRLPSKALLLSDVLYDVRTSGELNNPLIVFTTDKEFVKLYVKAVIGDDFNVPTLAVLRSFAELENYNFPSNCCVKSTHSSGRAIFRCSGSAIDLDELRGWLSHNYYEQTREPHYRQLTPKIVVEPIIFKGQPLTDYKILCYQGKPKMILAIKDQLGNPERKIFDTNWKEQSFCINSKKSSQEFQEPRNLAEMLKLAGKLSEPFSFVRVDMYSNDIRCFVGEITSCSWGACPQFFPENSEADLSRLIFC